MSEDTIAKLLVGAFAWTIFSAMQVRVCGVNTAPGVAKCWSWSFLGAFVATIVLFATWVII